MKQQIMEFPPDRDDAHAMFLANGSVWSILGSCALLVILYEVLERRACQRSVSKAKTRSQRASAQKTLTSSQGWQRDRLMAHFFIFQLFLTLFDILGEWGKLRKYRVMMLGVDPRAASADLDVRSVATMRMMVRWKR
jgi:Na+/melibiose symporter-like transporter